MLPTLFDGDWDTALIVTYGADLEFYERDLLRQLTRSRNRLVLADGRQVTRKLADPDARSQLRQVNRSYVLAPLQIDRAAHAKLIMLLSDDRGLFGVGSGNLGMTGYASQGECFTTYRWTAEDGSQLQEFLAARSFIDQLCERQLVDSVVQTRIKQAWANAPWLYGSVADAPTRIRHNLTSGLLDQFVEAIGGRDVDELVVHAPFYDHQCRALSELIDRTAPKKIQVLLQERLTSVDPQRLVRVLAAAPATVEVRSAQAEDKGTFLHAKFLIARCGRVAVCLQGSPNISTPALIKAFPDGNIELANLVVGKRGAFDHLVSSLVLSPKPVDVSELGLTLATDDADENDAQLAPAPAEFAWIAPNLTGVFGREVRDAPLLLVNDTPVTDVSWTLSEPADGMTRFSALVGADAASALNGVTAVSFIFESGEASAPSFPYHLHALMALASGHGRTDLLKQAGDFDLEDEELEELLAQLDEVLVVDGRSIWRMLKRKEPHIDEEDGSTSIAYEDLDWDAIQSHPKLAQYRNWSQADAADPTALGILLASINERFEADVERGRKGESTPDGLSSASDAFDDLARAIEAEDEEAAEEEESARERRRLTARSRARRQFHNFVQRFVNGLIDEEFIRRVGPSVIVPSYVVFNHLCWKLIQVDLADPLRIIGAQTSLWKFFWGDQDAPGYLAELSAGEQEAAREILDRHHSEAVLLCSLFQAYEHVWHEEDDEDLLAVRDSWRTVLLHPLWQPTKTAVEDSTTILRHRCSSSLELIEELDGLAYYVSDREPFAVLGDAVGAGPGRVAMKTGRVNRGSLGAQDVDIYAIDDLKAALTPQSASIAFTALGVLMPDIDYIRLEDRLHNVVAFADYQLEEFVFANRTTGDIEDLAPPATESPAWSHALDSLYEMAGDEVAA